MTFYPLLFVSAGIIWIAGEPWAALAVLIAAVAVTFAERAE